MSNHKQKKSKKSQTQKDYGSNYGSIFENADTKTRASRAVPSEAASSFRLGTQDAGSQPAHSQAGGSQAAGQDPRLPALRAFAEQNYANGMRDVFTMDYSGRGRLNFPEGGGGLGVLVDPFAMNNTIPGQGENPVGAGQFPMMYGMTPHCPIHGSCPGSSPDWMGMYMYGCQDPWGYPM